jgi:hypothetical protein
VATAVLIHAQMMVILAEAVLQVLLGQPQLVEHTVEVVEVAQLLLEVLLALVGLFASSGLETPAHSHQPVQGIYND